MTAIASFFIVMVLSLLVARVASTALCLTGVSREVARFQARSALTGTGFTTSEAETIVGHPVRRRIVMHLMLLRNAGLVTAVSSLILSFTGAEDTTAGLYRALLIVGGLAALWLLSLSTIFDRWLETMIRWALDRWTSIEARDYARLLDLGGAYSIKELQVVGDDWLIGRGLDECSLPDEGILLLAIRRSDGQFLGAPAPDTVFRSGDLLILYGERQAIRELDHRVKGAAGDAAHGRAVERQRRRQDEERQADQS